MQVMDANAHLRSLVGKTIHTIGPSRQPNKIIARENDHVLVGTRKSPAGERVRIADVQAALDLLERDRELLIDKRVVGYRSAFIGAFLATLPGAVASNRPRLIKLERD